MTMKNNDCVTIVVACARLHAVTRILLAVGRLKLGHVIELNRALSHNDQRQALRRGRQTMVYTSEGHGRMIHAERGLDTSIKADICYNEVIVRSTL